MRLQFLECFVEPASDSVTLAKRWRCYWSSSFAIA